jgi:hypothetical protein
MFYEKIITHISDAISQPQCLQSVTKTLQLLFLSVLYQTHLVLVTTLCLIIVSFSVVNGFAHITVPEGGKISIYNPITGNINSYDGSSIQYPYNSDLHIAITGHNKVPLIIETGTIFIQNETIAEDVSFEAQTIKVGSNVTTAKPNGEVMISSGITRLKGNTVELSSGTTIEIGAQLEINY